MLVTNAGYDPGEVLAQLGERGATGVFDVCSGRISGLADTAIWDITSTQRQIVRAAVSSAALALTVDVLVYHKNPERVEQP